MAQIQKLSIKRFKQLAEFEIDLEENTLLIGANNAGKSSVLQALHFAVSVAQTAKLVGDGVKWGGDKFALSFNPSQLLYSPIADVLSLGHGQPLQEWAGAQIEIAISCSDGTQCTVSVKRGRNRNISVALAGQALGEILMNMDSPFTVYAPGLAGVAKDERYMSPGVVRRVVARGDANLVLRNVLLMLKKAEDEERELRMAMIRRREIKTLSDGGWKGVWMIFQEDMQALFPGIKLDVKFDEARDENIEVFFRRPGKPTLPLDAAGTSILQASQILAYITLFRPSVLILDEPDSHLHPNNQRALCDVITDLSAARGFKALISTHSRHVLDSLRETANVVWLNDGKKVAYDSVSTAARLLDLGALDSIDYFTDGRLRCLFATEDSSADSMKALDALLRSNGFVMGDTDIRAYAGCSKVDSAKVLRRFLGDKAPGVRFIVHRDRDYMPDDAAAKFEKDIGAIDAYPFLTPLSDIDNIFLNADHLAHVNASNLTSARAQEIIDQATVEIRPKSIEKLINIRTDASLRDRTPGQSLNAGALAAAAQLDYDSDPVKWRRGKDVLKRVKSLLHAELKSEPKIWFPSPHLVSAPLCAMQKSIWPAKGLVAGPTAAPAATAVAAGAAGWKSNATGTSVAPAVASIVVRPPWLVAPIAAAPPLPSAAPAPPLSPPASDE